MVLYNGAVLSEEVPIEQFSKPHQSKPYNPVMASVFYKCGFIENWGRGTVNIINECIAAGLPAPTFEYEWTAVKVTFFRGAPQVSDQVSRHIQAILAFCHEPRAMQEIMDLIGVKHKTHFRKTLLNPLIEQGRLALTIPEKPQSRLQKYRTVIKD